MIYIPALITGHAQLQADRLQLCSLGMLERGLGVVQRRVEDSHWQEDVITWSYLQVLVYSDGRLGAEWQVVPSPDNAAEWNQWLCLALCFRFIIIEAYIPVVLS
jgi:hypothetical protein